MPMFNVEVMVFGVPGEKTKRVTHVYQNDYIQDLYSIIMNTIKDKGGKILSNRTHFPEWAAIDYSTNEKKYHVDISQVTPLDNEELLNTLFI